MVTLSGSSVRFSWIEPDNGAQEITAYTLEVLHYDGLTFSEERTTCDGSSDVSIVQNAYCEIPMTSLTVSPFMLPQDRLI